MGNSERSHKVDAKYEKLRLEVNELRCFKDLWIAHAYKNSKSVMLPFSSLAHKRRLKHPWRDGW